MADEHKTDVFLTPITQLTQEQILNATKIAEDFYTVFSNNIRLAVAPTEVRIVFGENTIDARGITSITELFSVVLTPTQAKFLAEQLTFAIGTLEAQFGPIHTFQAILARIANLQQKATAESPKAAPTPTSGH